MIQKITLTMDSDHRFTLSNNLTIAELTPKELLLYATALCAAETLRSLLKEHMSSVGAMEITMEGSLTTPTPQPESRYSHFNIVYRIECNTLKEQIIIGRAVNLTHDKYCGMIEMLRHIAPLTHETSIVTTAES
jgi:putative redox protein